MPTKRSAWPGDARERGHVELVAAIAAGDVETGEVGFGSAEQGGAHLQRLSRPSQGGRDGQQSDQSLDRVGGWSPKVDFGKLAEEPILPQGLGRVALGDMRADQDPVRALAQRVGGNARQSSLNREPEQPLGGERRAQRLERVQPQLPETARAR